MKKTRFLIPFIFITLFAISPVVLAEKDEIENQFPVDTAGITAYAKVSASGIELVAEALPFLDYLNDSGTTYALGTKKVSVKIEAEPGNSSTEEKIDVSFYMDANGWMAAFLEREEESSRIMQWTTYERGAIGNNVLEEVLNAMAEYLNVGLETPVDYYHFGYPEANRIALVVETINHPGEKDNSFSTVIPGTVHEVSYSLFYSLRNSSQSYSCAIKIEVDENEITSYSSSNCRGAGIVYGQYNLSFLPPNTPHLIRLSVTASEYLYFKTGAATAFIYQS